MSQEQAQTVEEVLQQVAAATTAAQEATPKKERKPRANLTQVGEAGEVQAKEPRQRKERAPREPKPPREPKEPRGKRVEFSLGGVSVNLDDLQNTAEIRIVRDLSHKEGSKRAERAKALEGAKTVQDFYVAGGPKKDLHRHMLSGAIEVYHEGVKVEVSAQPPVPRAPKAEGTETAQEDNTGGNNPPEEAQQ